MPNAYLHSKQLNIGPYNISTYVSLLVHGFSSGDAKFICHYFLLQNLEYPGNLITLVPETLFYYQCPMPHYEEFVFFDFGFVLKKDIDIQNTVINNILNRFNR